MKNYNARQQKYFQIVDDTAEIHFLQKSVTVLYHEAQLKYILKVSSILRQEWQISK